MLSGPLIAPHHPWYTVRVPPIQSTPILMLCPSASPLGTCCVSLEPTHRLCPEQGLWEWVFPLHLAQLLTFALAEREGDLKLPKAAPEATEPCVWHTWSSRVARRMDGLSPAICSPSEGGPVFSMDIASCPWTSRPAVM